MYMCKYVICTESYILGMICNMIFKLEELMHDFWTLVVRKQHSAEAALNFDVFLGSPCVLLKISPIAGQWHLGTNFCVSQLFVIVTNTRCKSS